MLIHMMSAQFRKIYNEPTRLLNLCAATFTESCCVNTCARISRPNLLASICFCLIKSMLFTIDNVNLCFTVPAENDQHSLN